MKIKTPHDHSWVFIRSKNYGVMNYDSAGGSVEDCILNYTAALFAASIRWKSAAAESAAIPTRCWKI